VSHWQGWLNSGDPVADRVLYDGTNGRGKPPVVLTSDADTCGRLRLCGETWYVLTAPWGPDIAWSASSTTWFYAGENAFTDRSTWRLSGDLGLTRGLEINWFRGRAGGGTTLVGKFYATQFGEVVSGPSDPRCGGHDREVRRRLPGDLPGADDPAVAADDVHQQGHARVPGPRDGEGAELT
jgi:hypothetical protein